MTEKKTQQKSLKKNSVFYLIYTVLNVVFPFLTGVYVARVLLPQDIGQIAFAQNIAQYFVVFAFLGIPTYGLREISRAKDDKEELDKLFSELFFINLVSTLCFCALYIALIFSVPSFKENLFIFLIVGLAIAFNAFDVSWLYEGLEEFKFISVRNVIFKILSFVLLVIFVRDQGDYYIYAAITVVGVVGNSLLNFIHTRKFVRFKVKGLNFKRHMKSIFLLVAVNLAIEVYTLIDTTMLGMLCEKQTVAYYSYGSKIYRILLQVVNTFTIVLVPRLSSYYAEKNYEAYNALLSKCLTVILLLVIPMIIGIQFVSEYLICKIYGSSYLTSSYVLKILSLMLLFSPIGYLLGSRVLLVSGHEGRMFMCVGIGAVVNAVGNFFFIRWFDGFGLAEVGAAISSAASEFLVMAIYVLCARKYFRLGGIFGSYLKILLASGLMTGYLVGCTFIPLPDPAVVCLQIFGAVAIYFAVLLVSREKTIIGVLDRIFKRKKETHERIES